MAEWFEWDGVLGTAEQVFVDELRQRAAAWSEPSPSGWVDMPDGGPLLAAFDIDSAEGQVSLLTVGVFFGGRTLRGDKLHNQLFTLPDEPGELAAVAADWFETILRRLGRRGPCPRRETVGASGPVHGETG